MKEYIDLLKSKGFSNSEIQTAVSIKTLGITMTKAVYKFNELYDSGEIDGFPDSSIEVLEKFYGKGLKKMKYQTLYDKVVYMQRTITDVIEEDSVKEAVEHYLS